MELSQGTATGPLRFSLPFNTFGSCNLIAETQDIRISFGGTISDPTTIELNNDRQVIFDAQPGAADQLILTAVNCSGTGQVTVRRDLRINGAITTDLSNASSQGFFIDNGGSLTFLPGSPPFTNKGKAHLAVRIHVHAGQYDSEPGPWHR